MTGAIIDNRAKIREKLFTKEADKLANIAEDFMRKAEDQNLRPARRFLYANAAVIYATRSLIMVNGVMGESLREAFKLQEV